MPTRSKAFNWRRHWRYRGCGGCRLQMLINSLSTFMSRHSIKVWHFFFGRLLVPISIILSERAMVRVQDSPIIKQLILWIRSPRWWRLVAPIVSTRTVLKVESRHFVTPRLRRIRIIAYVSLVSTSPVVFSFRLGRGIVRVCPSCFMVSRLRIPIRSRIGKLRWHRFTSLVIELWSMPSIAHVRSDSVVFGGARLWKWPFSMPQLMCTILVARLLIRI